MVTTHVMDLERIPGALGTTAGYVLCKTKQLTAAAVANNDILQWKNVRDVIPLRISSELGSLIDFDAKTTTSPNIAYTVNTTVITTGTASTRIDGMVLVKF